MKTYSQLIAEALPGVDEKFPWDVEDLPDSGLLLVDIREPYEFEAMKIKGSINAPRGILEQCCEWNFEETIPQLVRARDQDILLICHSGNRSILAASTMKELGYERVYSLKTGLRGWHDYELPLIDMQGQPVDTESADIYFTPRVREEQKNPDR